MVFVLNGNVAGEALSFEFGQQPGHVGDAGAIGHVMCPTTHFVQVLEVAADNAPFEDAETVHRVEAGTDPVACVGAGPDPRITVFDHGQAVSYTHLTLP